MNTNSVTNGRILLQQWKLLLSYYSAKLLASPPSICKLCLCCFYVIKLKFKRMYVFVLQINSTLLSMFCTWFVTLWKSSFPMNPTPPPLGTFCLSTPPPPWNFQWSSVGGGGIDIFCNRTVPLKIYYFTIAQSGRNVLPSLIMALSRPSSSLCGFSLMLSLNDFLPVLRRLLKKEENEQQWC